MSIDNALLHSPPELALSLERQISRRTCGRIAQLGVEPRSGTLVVSGRSPTYYIKQLAIQAVREVLGDDDAAPPIVMDIQVGATGLPIGRAADHKRT